MIVPWWKYRSGSVKYTVRPSTLSTVRVSCWDVCFRPENPPPMMLFVCFRPMAVNTTFSPGLQSTGDSKVTEESPGSASIAILRSSSRFLPCAVNEPRTFIFLPHIG